MQHLGGHDAGAFLARYWQKEALLVRAAFASFAPDLDAKALLALAQRDDVESRLVVRSGRQWSLTHGPFRRSDFKSLPERNWTLLVQGVNLHYAPADALLRQFAFLPYARLDDVMVSYATPGGGVGPHFDSYDVFLLQGSGRRRWRYGRQADLSLRADLPLKILRRFTPQYDTVLAAGDMLYLPPAYAHEGTALDHCFTWSIGFRAPAATELAAAFLDYLRDALELPGQYADPDLRPTRKPARIDAARRRRCRAMLAGIAWDRTTVDRFLGCWLSEPKPQVFFAAPATPLSRAAFLRRAAREGLLLSAATQLLYDAQQLYINGVALAWPQEGRDLLAGLADRRDLAPALAAKLPPAIVSVAYDWYRQGFLALGSA